MTVTKNPALALKMLLTYEKYPSNHVHHNGSKKALTQVFTVNGGIAVFARR